jgi:hypothetical protein
MAEADGLADAAGATGEVVEGGRVYPTIFFWIPNRRAAAVTLVVVGTANVEADDDNAVDFEAEDEDLDRDGDNGDDDDTFVGWLGFDSEDSSI